MCVCMYVYVYSKNAYVLHICMYVYVLYTCTYVYKSTTGASGPTRLARLCVFFFSQIIHTNNKKPADLPDCRARPHLCVDFFFFFSHTKYKPARLGVNPPLTFFFFSFFFLFFLLFFLQQEGSGPGQLGIKPRELAGAPVSVRWRYILKVPSIVPWHSTDTRTMTFQNMDAFSKVYCAFTSIVPHIVRILARWLLRICGRCPLCEHPAHPCICIWNKK